MSRRDFTGFGSFLLAIVIGIVGAIALTHFSVCEQDDRKCLFTGEVSK